MSSPTDGAARPPLCLIGGTGRSGTTLLWRIFARHPSVATFPTEARFLTDPDGIVDFQASMAAWTPFTFDVRVRRLERLLRDLGPGRVPVPAGSSRVIKESAAPTGRRRMPQRVAALVSGSPLRNLLPRYGSVNLAAACPGYEDLVTELIDRLVTLRYPGRWMGSTGLRPEIRLGGWEVAEPLRSFCRGVVDAVCNDQRASHLVEDSPFNLLAFPMLRELLPESRLVHIYRDPRDVVASYLQRPWSPSDPVGAARLYASIMERWESVRGDLPDGSYLEVSLGALVRDPEPTIRSISAFWELTWADEVLKIDLSRSNAGRWQRDLPPRSVAEVERILAPFRNRYDG